MEYIKKEDLIKDEIYKCNNSNNSTYIIKATESLHDVIAITPYDQFMKNGNFNGSFLTFTNATFKEKHWLEVCIAASKFVTYNEAMKTIIPEYVECIKPNDWIQTIKNNNNNLIFDTKNERVHIFNNNWKNIIKIMSTPFKPSTKEAYDTQFVIKKPEPLPQFKVIEKVETITKVENNEGNQFFIGDIVTTDTSDITETIKSFEYQLNKTVLVAVFTNNSFININSIEHYIYKFILPEKWCLKITNENFNFCKDLRNNELGFHKNYIYTVNGYYTSVKNHGCFGFCNIPIGYTEITFDQFKKYVLKETVDNKSKI